MNITTHSDSPSPRDSAVEMAMQADDATIPATASPSSVRDTRPHVVAICMASAVAICSLLLVFGVCLLDSITSYEFGSVQTIVLATVLAIMNAVLSWLFVTSAGSMRDPGNHRDGSGS